MLLVEQSPCWLLRLRLLFTSSPIDCMRHHHQLQTGEQQEHLKRRPIRVCSLPHPLRHVTLTEPKEAMDGWEDGCVVDECNGEKMDGRNDGLLDERKMGLWLCKIPLEIF